eukprot:719691-Hanusia_phi.AAC.1
MEACSCSECHVWPKKKIQAKDPHCRKMIGPGNRAVEGLCQEDHMSISIIACQDIDRWCPARQHCQKKKKTFE